jgi:hypothetical protein
MKNLLSVLLTFILCSSCSTLIEVEPYDKNLNINTTSVTAKVEGGLGLNGKGSFIFKNSDSKKIHISLSSQLDPGEHIESINIYGIPLEAGTCPLEAYTNYGYDGTVKYSFLIGGDASGPNYDLDNSAKNYVTISGYDKTNKLLSGSFQLTFKRNDDLKKTKIPRPDIVKITEGAFKIILRDK